MGCAGLETEAGADEVLCGGNGGGRGERKAGKQKGKERGHHRGCRAEERDPGEETNDLWGFQRRGPVSLLRLFLNHKSVWFK